MENLKEKFTVLMPHLDEKSRRLIAAAETMGKGHGVRGEVSRATGVSYREIRRGLEELHETPENRASGIRKKGGGRKKIDISNPTILEDLKALISASTRGDPCSPLLWTSKSLRKIESELKEKGHVTSYSTIGRLLEQMGYRLQANRKANHPKRDAQFEHINNKALEFQEAGQPVISVDCKKHELIENYKNALRESHPKEKAPEAKDHDFIDKELGKAIPYGVYDLLYNSGFVNIGIDHDTSVFAVESIRSWWRCMGQKRYPEAKRLMIDRKSVV
jgi:hypothetical protein